MATLSLKTKDTPRLQKLRGKTKQDDLTHWLFSLPVFKEVKPLKIGIREELLAMKPDGISNKSIRVWLWKYCKSPKYKQALKDYNHRFDIHGKPCGLIDKDRGH